MLWQKGNNKLITIGIGIKEETITRLQSSGTFRMMKAPIGIRYRVRPAIIKAID